MAIIVSKEVLEGLEAVRQSGVTNMFDRPKVVYVAREMGFEEAAQWAEQHRSEYAHGIIAGFAVEGESGNQS